ncbi:unnamed protein product [Discula destructiva]
MNSLALDNYS